MVIPNDRKYVIIAAADVARVDFSEVLEDQAYLRYSIDGTLVVLKYEGTMPSSISALRPTEYTLAQITAEMQTTEWQVEEEAGLYD